MKRFFLGQVIADEAVGVLDCAPFGGAIGMRKVDSDASFSCEFLVASELFSVVQSQRVDQSKAF